MRDKKYYSELGFKCGLEIHQRLATSSKLFCKCSADAGGSKPIMHIERRQRAVAGETGIVDSSTMFESRKGRLFIYHLYDESTCLVDIDEEPPGETNPEAVETAIYISKSLNAVIPDEIEPMRKNVVDGSDPSAFQRTMLCGYSGTISSGDAKIPISSIFLEEESSGIISGSQSEANYSVDRLGIPLIEIDTDPVLSTPDEAKKAAMQIGLLLRLTGKVQRGIGSIRQDVNVSIKGGARVEIKGLQEIDGMDELIDNEVTRQLKLISIKAMLAERKASIGSYMNLSDILRHTEAKIVSEQLWQGGIVLGVKLSGFAGILGTEINPKIRLGSEISSYVKMAEAKGIIHSDENMDSYGFKKAEIEEIKKTLDIGPEDAFMLIAEERNRCMRAMDLAILRAKLAIYGVPSETRAANPSGNTTRFLRPIPGGSRMYPETDAVPIEAAPFIKKAKSNKIDIEKMRSSLLEQIKNKQVAEQMLWSKDLQTYEELVHKTNANPSIVAYVLLEKMKEMKRSGIDTESISAEALEYTFTKYAKHSITKQGIEEILRSVPKNRWDVDKAIREKKLSRMDKEELSSIIASMKGADRNAIIREIMSKYRLRVDGEELNSMLK